LLPSFSSFDISKMPFGVLSESQTRWFVLTPDFSSFSQKEEKYG